MKISRLTPLFLSVLLFSCRLPGSAPQNQTELLGIVRQSEDPQARFAAIEQIIISRDSQQVTTLLGEVLEQNPEDPYGSYYLMALAENARESGSAELAMDYFRRLLKNYPDLEIQGQSLHLLVMNELAVASPYPREVIAMRQEMQRRYPFRIDEGYNLYELAEAYRAVGDWDAMYQAYADFLKHPDSVIPGVPEAHSRVRDLILFHNSTKSWVVQDLDTLVNGVKQAIRTQNGALLNRYQADNFFLMNWSQRTSDSFTHIPMTLESFLKSSIRYRNTLESFSNDREAYLWTAGWSWKIPTWYLYFRRVDYPADPEINGGWEWAGIYFGERL